MDEFGEGSGKKMVEVRYEIQMGQLLVIVMIGLLIATVAGFWIGRELGLAKGFGQVVVDKPDYCTADNSEGKVIVKCNELGNVSLDNLCAWASPELKEKIKLVIVT